MIKSVKFVEFLSILRPLFFHFKIKILILAACSGFLTIFKSFYTQKSAINNFNIAKIDERDHPQHR